MTDRPRVLLVEDETRTAEVICAVLNSAGYTELDVATTAARAEASIRASPPI